MENNPIPVVNIDVARFGSEKTTMSLPPSLSLPSLRKIVEAIVLELEPNSAIAINERCFGTALIDHLITSPATRKVLIMGTGKFRRYHKVYSHD